MDTNKQAACACNRRFMSKAGVSAFLGAIGLAGVGAFIGLKPTVSPEPSQQFKIGPPQDYPPGTRKIIASEKVAIFSDEAGLYAISLICTHLGCIVTLNEKEEQFECPCHGSKFALDGKVTNAPAPKPLDWYLVSLHPSGQLMIDKSVTVEVGTKVAV